MNNLLSGLIAVGISFFLTACGSGSGEAGADTQAGNSPDTALAITVSNSDDVTASTVSAVSSTTNAGGDTIAFSASIESDSTEFEISQFFYRLLADFPDHLLQDTDLATGIVISPITIDCSDPDFGGVSGQVTLSAEIATRSNITAGDKFNAEFFNCEIEPGVFGSGVMNFVINSFSGDVIFYSAPYQLAADITFEDFSVTSGQESYFADGDMTIDINVGSNNISSLLATGDFITVKEGASTQIRLFDYSVSEVLDTVSNTFVQEQSGTLDSVLLGGSVTFSTIVPFVGTIGENPNTGTLLMEGASSSAARLVVIDENDVQIFVDEDGDGTFGPATTIAWADLTL